MLSAMRHSDYYWYKKQFVDKILISRHKEMIAIKNNDKRAIWVFFLSKYLNIGSKHDIMWSAMRHSDYYWYKKQFVDKLLISSHKEMIAIMNNDKRTIWVFFYRKSHGSDSFHHYGH